MIAGDRAVEVEQRISASPETVFSYLTDPLKFILWMGVGADLDPRPGGAFRIDADRGYIAVGEYRDVDPPRRLLMTWGWQGDESVPPGSTLVEITLTPDGAGTLLRLRHTGLPDEKSRESHRGGWILNSARLVALLPDPGHPGS